jgi:hypothetical protein
MTCRPEKLELFALSIFLLFDFFPLFFCRFSPILLASSVKKRELLFFLIKYFLFVFGPRLIFFKSVENVISSREVSKGSLVLRVLNRVSAEIGNTFGEVVTDIEGTQTRSIARDAIYIGVTISLVSEVYK